MKNCAAVFVLLACCSFAASAEPASKADNGYSCDVQLLNVVTGQKGEADPDAAIVMVGSHWMGFSLTHNDKTVKSVFNGKEIQPSVIKVNGVLVNHYHAQPKGKGFAFDLIVLDGGNRVIAYLSDLKSEGNQLYLSCSIIR